MAEVTSDSPITEPKMEVSTNDPFWKREMAGASFLSLEHFLHMLLVVVLAVVLAMGVNVAISLWTNTGTGSPIIMPMMFPSVSLPVIDHSGDALTALGVVAALIVLVPLALVLDRRTRAEWAKRPGFAGRVAYKLPVYGALAALVVGKIIADIVMLTVVLQSLAYLGVSSAPDMGMLYLTQFVPALVAAVIFGVMAWYVFKLAKGQDLGDAFGNMLGIGSLLFVVALLITAFVVLHGNTQSAVPQGGKPGVCDALIQSSSCLY